MKVRMDDGTEAKVIYIIILYKLKKLSIWHKMSLNLQTLSGHILTASSQFSCYLPTAQKMIDSFKINYDGATTTPIPPASSPSITTAHPSSDELSIDHSSSSG
jgi:hypothetical protein